MCFNKVLQIKILLEEEERSKRGRERRGEDRKRRNKEMFFIYFVYRKIESQMLEFGIWNFCC